MDESNQLHLYLPGCFNPSPWSRASIHGDQPVPRARGGKTFKLGLSQVASYQVHKSYSQALPEGACYCAPTLQLDSEEYTTFIILPTQQVDTPRVAISTDYTRTQNHFSHVTTYP